MNDVERRTLRSPLAWADFIYDLQDRMADHPDPLYIVGGAVRDAYLRRPLKDVDLVTTGSGRKAARRIANAFGGNYFPLDDERDVGRALIDTADGRLTVDVAACRGDTLHADLFDRDFTVNALAVALIGDLQGVFDPTGGIDDLYAKRIRQCNPASLTRDPLRALRGVRQSAQFGFRIEVSTLDAMRGIGQSGLGSISAERVRDEFFKLLLLPRPTVALRVLETLGLLSLVLPEADWLREAGHWTGALATCEQVIDLWTVISPYRTDATVAQFQLGMLAMQIDRYRAALQAHTAALYGGERAHRALLGLAALVCDLPTERIETLAERMRLSNEERDVLMTLMMQRDLFSRAQTDRLGIYRFWKATGKTGIDVVLLGLASALRDRVLFRQDQWLALIEKARVLYEGWFHQQADIVDPPSLVRGIDLIKALNLPAGRWVGETLEAIREGQVAGTIQTVEDALSLAHERWRHSQA